MKRLDVMSKSGITTKEIQEAAEMYLKKGKRMTEIGWHFDRSPGAFLYHFKRLGIYPKKDQKTA